MATSPPSLEPSRLTPGTPGRMPVQLTSFVGREREVAELCVLLGRARLLTLTGAGGSGKTRLALRVAAEFAAERRHEVVWVDLTAVRTSDQVLPHVAVTLGVREEADRPTPVGLLTALAERELLLALDNCEHVVDACAQLTDLLLRHCPRLRILATSREALEIDGERAWLVPALSLPPPEPADGLQAVHGSEAVALFLERAQAALATFELSETNAGAVAQICRRLDGLPLAIELAAARVRVLTPQQIAERLDQLFQLLTGGSRTAPPRHRTLRAATDWSYELLDPPERLLLQRLSVFSGGFTLEGAEAVCAAEGIAEAGVLDLLAALIDKSLVSVRAAHGEARYHLLETVRQYGRERLLETQDAEACRRRHAQFFLRLAEAAEPHLLMGGADASWVRRLESELGNLRAAVEFFRLAPEGTEMALRMVSALDWFYYASGHLREARGALESGLREAGELPVRVRARALLALGNVALWQGDVAGSVGPLRECVALLRPVGDGGRLAYALTRLGVAISLAGEPGEGEASLDEATSLHPAGSDDLAVCLRAYRAYVSLLAGDYPRAAAHYADAVALARATGHTRATAHLVTGLGRVAAARGDRALARSCFLESLASHRAVGDGWGVAQALHGLAGIVAAEARHEHSVRLLGAADAARERLGAALRPDERAQWEDTVAQLRDALGDAVFSARFAEGRAAPLDRLMEGLQSSAPTPVRPPEPSTPEAPALHVRALGPLEIHLAGTPLPAQAWSHGKPRELLLYLLCHPQGRTREQVGLAFWPDSTPDQLRNRFHVTLHHLRKTLGRADMIRLVDDRYRLDSEVSCEFDVARFEAALADAQLEARREGGSLSPLRATLALYRGDFLEGEAAGDWHLEHRDRLHRLYIGALSLLGERLMLQQAYAEASEILERVVALESLDEAAHRQLMICLARQGERTRALRVYERLVLLLREELDTEPDPETRQLYQSLSEVLPLPE